MIGKILHKLRLFMTDSLYRNSFFLFLNSASTALTGFLFWALAARLFSTHDVGIVSTLIAAATFVGSASILGLDHTLIHYLGKHPKKMRVILNTAFSVAIIGVVISSVLYLAIVPALSPDLSFILTSVLWIIGFLLLMLVTSWNNLLTSTFIGLRITQFIFLSGLFFGILRIIFLPILVGYGFTGLFLAHLISFSVGVLAAFMFIFIAKRYVFVPRITSETVSLMKKYSLKTYVASLLASLPPLLTPLLVISLLGPSEVAYYNMPLMIITVLTIIPMATSQSLFAEGVNGGNDLRRHIMRAIRLIYAVLIPAILVVIASGNIVLQLFGKAYAEHGYPLLILLCIATLFKAGSFPLIATLRVMGDIKEIIIITLMYVITIVGLVYASIASVKSLWVIGASVIVSEIIALILYIIVVKRKWSKIVAIKPGNNQEEIYA
jgi:O-antigen/teichoic acid export membrane protein